MKSNQIVIEGARENNLKNISLGIPKNKLVVITGVSGSGKSSLAFDTVYAEGYRRYMENFSNSARFFLTPIKKPKVDKIHNLSPTIAIGQKSFANNPRSTVGTITGIYDLMRALYANYGVPHCPKCGKEMIKNTPNDILERIKNLEKGTIIHIIARWSAQKSLEQKINSIKNLGYSRVKINNNFYKIKQFNIENQGISGDAKVNVVIDRLILDNKKFDKERILDSMFSALRISENKSKIVIDNDEEIFFNQNYNCPDGCGSLGNLKVKNFSFNSPDGACEKCKGLGQLAKADVNKLISNKKLSLAEGAIVPWLKSGGRQDKENYYDSILRAFAKKYKFSLKKPVNKISKEIFDILMFGDDESEELEIKSEGKIKKIKFQGITKIIEDKYYNAKTNFFKNELERYMVTKKCPECRGRRLKESFLNVRVFGKTIDELVLEEVELLHLYFSKNEIFNKKISQLNSGEKDFVAEMRLRLKCLIDVGVGYLNLDRSCQTLSGGEFQKVRLVNQLNSGLSGILYVLDEPTIGLHSRDNKRLIKTLEKIRDNGNSVIVIEHDREIIEAADHIIEIGPMAGEEGGKLVFQGSYKSFLNNEKIETVKYLKKKFNVYEEIIDEKNKNNKTEKIIIKGAEENNLRKIDVEIPLERLVAVVGISGSGKSSLINDILVKALRKRIYKSSEEPGKHKAIKNSNKIAKIINVDQSPLGKSSRSNPATYTGVFSEIRKLFAQTNGSKQAKLSASHFSFNMKGGRCEYCQGEGIQKMEMNFLEDVFRVCPYCHGTRYNEKIRKIKYHGVSIAEVLNMNIDYAYYFFSSNSQIKRRLKTLRQVGLGYLKLGQSSSKLSGGEAQRIKLATELARSSRGNALYILDEPSVGLHFNDIIKLLRVLRKLVQQGNSVIIVEHNLDIIEACDWILELGLEGGEKGGDLVFEGTFEGLKKAKTWTGKMLR